MLGHGFISHVTHISLVRHCASAKFSNKPAGSANPASPRKSQLSRAQKADQMMADYAAFARDRYKNHWEPNIGPISGQFPILSVADSFLIVDEPRMGLSPFCLSG